ncbi:MAG: hypothetical protein EBU85_06360, partial [Actinobacteria bacterium]|nr:hypothetical protein [Actinomycetota bacterium]
MGSSTRDPADHGRNQQQGQAEDHRQPGQQVNLEGRIEDPLDMGRRRQPVRAAQGHGEPGEAGAQRQEDRPVKPQHRQDRQAGRQHPGHGPVRLDRQSGGGDHHARCRRQIAPSRKGNQHHRQQDKARLDRKSAQ